MSSKIVRILSAASFAAALLIGASPASAQTGNHGNMSRPAVTKPGHGHVQPAVHHVRSGSHHRHIRRIHHNRGGRR